ncbi:DUF2971 domain-containing protein [Vibrio parahaemolyticus]|uniref:DUF2971 domain-containing protein n=1 Tax=Vibrio parahaemolyticus TaxID=670 RepID=UPI0004177D99|nr:DUF2971 domain-containing protein [Vibrio parahaemolyticus]EIZ1547604.1 DUF2971 domain-containing protein [Vibrio parahaemolyticus]ELA9429246.1 DUF2971 domain-containing protein [Vibrio parahaemolyticus]HCG9200521.1 DUF2971 domain-containing protein [Vibrio parahaemolyticus]
MKYPNIKTLYKYRAFRVRNKESNVIDERLINSLLKEEIWISSPDSFNDPFDCNLRPGELGVNWEERLTELVSVFVNSPKKLLEVIRNKHPKLKDSPDEQVLKIIESMFSDDLHAESMHLFRKSLLDELWTKFKDNVESIGVYSLSETQDNPLLWAHYGDDHKGFCVEYERNEDNLLGNERYTFPVRYSYEYPNISMSDILHLDDLENGGNLSAEQTFVGAIMLTKSDHWAYEKEWRIISHGNNMLCDAPGKITSLIFGLRMPEEDRRYLKDKFGDTVRYKEIVMVEGEFRLKAINIESA